MANPNIVNVTSIFGKTFAGALTTSTVALLTNPADSGAIYKVNMVVVSNVDGATAAEVTLSIGSSVFFPIASTVTVPSDSTLVVSSKETSFYLEEGWEIRGLASANGDLNVIISYEIIS